MVTILVRNIFLIYKLLNSFLIYLLPTKLKPSCNTATTTATSPLPCHLPNELQRVFDMFDKNKDGKITQSELGDSLEQIGIPIMGPELGPMIAHVDLNGDGHVDIKEFGKLYESIVEEGDKGNEKEVREAFEVFDKDGDGFICAEELRAVLGALGIQQGQCTEECKKMIMTVDVNGDGLVDFVEFKQMMRQSQGKIA